MLTDITLGQYMPGKSILHSMDPRVKVVLLFFYVVAIFFLDSYVDYLLLCFFTLWLIHLSSIHVATVFKSIKPIIWIILFTFIFHIFNGEGETLAYIGSFSITREGIIKGGMVSIRLMLLIIASSLLMYTTPPLKLTNALEDLLSPLKKIKFPVHEVAMMMTIAIRFIPTLMEETDKIMKAQQSRGVDFSSGSILIRGRLIMPIIVPLFISSFRRADELAVAMEARCYRGGLGRTRMNNLRVRKLDYICIGWFIVIVMILVIFKYLGY